MLSRLSDIFFLVEYFLKCNEVRMKLELLKTMGNSLSLGTQLPLGYTSAFDAV